MLSIKREDVPTETGKKLYDLLKKSWDNQNFIYSVLMRLRGDTNKQKLIDLIEKEGITDSYTITLASIDIADGEI